MPSKQRHSAFDDFPAEPQPSSQDWQQEQPHQTAEPSANEENRPAYALFRAPSILSQPEAPQVERIERLKPSQMMPDRFQPRRLLPTSLRTPFYSGKIDCYQAAERWLQMAQNDTSLQAEIDRLRAMGSSFEEHGQIKPITGSWVEAPDGGYRFQIETGERRFWAACLNFVAEHQRQEPMLRVEVIAAPTRMRQVLENRHAEPPSAVGQACEIASLILAEIGMQPTGQEADEFDYFRQANTIKKMPTGLWEKITPIMQISRSRMEQMLKILTLPTPLLDLADRYRLPERVLRAIFTAPAEQRENLLKISIQESLTAEAVTELSQEITQRSKPEKQPAAPDPVQQAINAMKRFAAAIRQLDEDTQSAVLDELANDMVISNQAEALMPLLRDLSERMRVRQQNKTRRR